MYIHAINISFVFLNLRCSYIVRHSPYCFFALRICWCGATYFIRYYAHRIPWDIWSLRYFYEYPSDEGQDSHWHKFRSPRYILARMHPTTHPGQWCHKVIWPVRSNSLFRVLKSRSCVYFPGPGSRLWFSSACADWWHIFNPDMNEVINVVRSVFY